MGRSEVKKMLTHPKVELVTSSFQTILGGDLTGPFAGIDVEQNRHIRYQAGRRPARELADLARVEDPASPLIGDSRVNVAVADDDLALSQSRNDNLVDVLSLVGVVQQSLSARGDRPGARREHQLADPLPKRARES